MFQKNKQLTAQLEGFRLQKSLALSLSLVRSLALSLSPSAFSKLAHTDIQADAKLSMQTHPTSGNAKTHTRMHL